MKTKPLDNQTIMALNDMAKILQEKETERLWQKYKLENDWEACWPDLKEGTAEQCFKSGFANGLEVGLRQREKYLERIENIFLEIGTPQSAYKQIMSIMNEYLDNKKIFG